MDTDGKAGFADLLCTLRADAGLSLYGTADDPSMPSSLTLAGPWGAPPYRVADHGGSLTDVMVHVPTLGEDLRRGEWPRWWPLRSGDFDLRHQHPKRQGVLFRRQRLERLPSVGHPAVTIPRAHEHQPTVHFQMGAEPGQRLRQRAGRLILSLQGKALLTQPRSHQRHEDVEAPPRPG